MATMTMTFPAIPISSTMTATPNATSTSSASGTTTSCCPNCGLTFPPASDAQIALLRAQKQIQDLEAQVRLLNQKAAAAVDRWADYEDELSRLRAASTTSVGTTTTNTNNTSASNRNSNTNSNSNGSPRSTFLPAGAAARISQLLAPRKSVPNLASHGARGSISTAAITPPTATTTTTAIQNGNGGQTNELLEALSRERELRAQAEGKLRDTSKEVEELSVTLFEQANEMVASERRARALLEERVLVLERRDVEKRDRLDRLEGAVGRLERVKAVLEER
ncbi:uncharacterized protein F4812DRAFT_74859 [Daldinia caldariorum]|uniref:uncharacterized protein n=1 Tax=Daldinia caldariorum TaxID=326644 RepID=UPI0020082EA6|nr:uncharacterized protein F4812DRAFT_74859 [Daldinia caldariorum]KAI1466316.1 hypothetical protein F4812DRAFT_74859 [Daldinia caldariorum]